MIKSSCCSSNPSSGRSLPSTGTPGFAKHSVMEENRQHQPVLPRRELQRAWVVAAFQTAQVLYQDLSVKWAPSAHHPGLALRNFLQARLPHSVSPCPILLDQTSE